MKQPQKGILVSTLLVLALVSLWAAWSEGYVRMEWLIASILLVGGAVFVATMSRAE